MLKRFVSFLVLATLASAMVPVMGLSGGAGDSPQDIPSEILIWEGYAKGYVTVVQEEYATFLVTNDADVNVRIDERVQMLSPSPLDISPDYTTQDGSLTIEVIPPHSSLVFSYGDNRQVEYPPPLWWCTEDSQVTLEGISMTLGGEVLPYALENLIESLPREQIQPAMWLWQEEHSVLVIGKTPLWKEIAENEEKEIKIQLAITNTGFEEAENALVTDMIPSGYSYDPNSFNPEPDSIEVDPNGNTILRWHISLDGAIPHYEEWERPADYDYTFITYVLRTPELEEGRYFLPRAYVDNEGDGRNDAHSAKPLLEAYHINNPPTANAGGYYYVPEGSILTLDASASTDPDGDKLQYRWDVDSDDVWDTSWSTEPTLDILLGDDYAGLAKLEVSDGEDSDIDYAYYIIENKAPTLSLIMAPSGNEGDTFDFEVQVADPGSDDLSLSWSGDCTGWPTTAVLYPNDPSIVPDPYPSPEYNPRDVSNSQSILCGDDGEFRFTLFVEDDDGGEAALEGTFQVGNLPPSLTVSPPSSIEIDEGTSVTLQATATDPGSDDITMIWDWEYGPTETRIFYNNGVGPDPQESPDGIFPFTVSDSSTHTYGDDCLCDVTLTVTDDDGGILVYTTEIAVRNLAPEIVSDIKAYVRGDLTLRVAGEKWHDVVLRLFEGKVGVATASIVRMPGSPDEQSVTIHDVVMDLLDGQLWAVVEYTPLDDPVNGQWLGADPAWLIFTPEGSEEGFPLHHTFNVEHPETWIWTVESFTAFLVGVDITFEASGTDPGSDDLIFTWIWGDGNVTENVHFNDGVGPDAYPSPDVNPITAMDVTKHAYGTAGTYTITLRITDDDGGEAVATRDIRIG